jgi:hypothetical protein
VKEEYMLMAEHVKKKSVKQCEEETKKESVEADDLVTDIQEHK